MVQSGQVVYFDLDDRSIRWQNGDRHFRGQLTLAGDVVYVLDTNGIVNVLDAHTGAALWTWAGPEEITQAMLATVDHLFVSSERNTYAIDLATQQTSWTYAAGGELSMSPQGNLFIAGTDGNLTVVQTLRDSDDDGMPDQWENVHGFNTADSADAAADADGDGLNNGDEYTYGTDPSAIDSDGDGLTDGDEPEHDHRPGLRGRPDGGRGPQGTMVPRLALALRRRARRRGSPTPSRPRFPPPARATQPARRRTEDADRRPRKATRPGRRRRCRRAS